MTIDFFEMSLVSLIFVVVNLVVFFENFFSKIESNENRRENGNVRTLCTQRLNTTYDITRTEPAFRPFKAVRWPDG